MQCDFAGQSLLFGVVCSRNNRFWLVARIPAKVVAEEYGVKNLITTFVTRGENEP